jgi:hypothetical protein
MGRHAKRDNGAPPVMIVSDARIVAEILLERGLKAMISTNDPRTIKIWIPESYDWHNVLINGPKALVCFRRLVDLHDPNSLDRIINLVKYCSVYWDDKRYEACQACPR